MRKPERRPGLIVGLSCVLLLVTAPPATGLEPGAASRSPREIADEIEPSAVNGRRYLNRFAQAGSGTTVDPWIVSADGGDGPGGLGWDEVKGGVVIVPPGHYEIAHGAELDVPSGTHLRCDRGAVFRLPSAPRGVGEGMFRIANNATSVEISDCTWDPGIPVSTEDTCPTAGDAEIGTMYIDIGPRSPEAGAVEFRITGNLFRACRRSSPFDDGRQINLATGSRNALLANNTFEICYQQLRALGRAASVANTHQQLRIHDNVFDMQGYRNLPCGKQDAAIAANKGPASGLEWSWLGLSIERNVFQNSDVGVKLAGKGDSLVFRGNVGRGEYLDGFLGFRNFTNITIQDNTCNDGETELRSQGCEFTVGDSSHLVIQNNNIRSVGIDMIRLTGVSHAVISDNYLNVRLDGPNVANCIVLAGDGGDDIRIHGNTCVDATDLVEIRGNQTNVVVDSNVLTTEHPGAGILEHIVKFSGGACDGCRAANNRIAGEDSTRGAWTNDLGQFDDYGGNSWKADSSDAAGQTGGMILVSHGGAAWTIDPGPALTEDATWTYPGTGPANYSLVPDGDSLRWGRPGYWLDAIGNETRPSSDGDPAADYDSAELAYDGNSKTFAETRFLATPTVRSHDFAFPAGPAGRYVIRVVHAMVGLKCDVPGAFARSRAEFLYCVTGPGCVPDTVFVEREGAFDETTEVFELADVDPSDLVVRVRARGTGVGGPPPVSRCRHLIHELGLTDAGYGLEPPAATRYPTYPGTSAETFGIVLWGNGAHPGYPNGQALCKSIGLSCKDAYLLDGSGPGCETNREGLFLALCHE